MMFINVTLTCVMLTIFDFYFNGFIHVSIIETCYGEIFLLFVMMIHFLKQRKLDQFICLLNLLVKLFVYMFSNYKGVCLAIVAT